LLIADPDLSKADEFVLELRREHLDVELCLTAADALVAAGIMRPDAVLIAAKPGGLPTADVVRVLSERTRIPILVGIGARQRTLAKSVLSAGATGCIARPYRLPELLSVIRSIRPSGIHPDEPIESGALRLDPATLEVVFNGQSIRLRPREYLLLRFLVVNADRVVTREQIYDAVWGGPAGDVSNTLTVHVKRLRWLLADDNKNPRLILTVRGIGYRFVPPNTRTGRQHA
jgi:DNA-binding response OmpR family regulator